MTGVLLQVRLDSTRLPNKALLELGGRSVIEHAMLSLRRVPASVHAIVTDASSAPLLRPRAQRCGFQTYVGPKDNVLERYVLAARTYGLTEVARATGDNPLVSWELARLAISGFRREAADYFGFDGPPLGTGVEVVRVAALERAIRESDAPFDREHVTPYLYRNPEQFRVCRVSAPPSCCLPHARVTLDTPEDYAALCEIYDAVYAGSPVPIRRLVRWLRSTGAMTAALHEEDAYSSRA